MQTESTRSQYPSRGTLNAVGDGARINIIAFPADRLRRQVFAAVVGHIEQVQAADVIARRDHGSILAVLGRRGSQSFTAPRHSGGTQCRVAGRRIPVGAGRRRDNRRGIGGVPVGGQDRAPQVVAGGEVRGMARGTLPRFGAAAKGILPARSCRRFGDQATRRVVDRGCPRAWALSGSRSGCSHRRCWPRPRSAR